MISIRGLSVELGDFSLKSASLDVAEGEYLVILGPTGAGKTVLLESIAGLFPIQSGQIFLRGKDVTGLSPEHRKVSIVYQDHALFPHLSVRQNIEFGLKARKLAPHEINHALDQVVELLAITHLLPRKPSTLSGGERQKVAMARALCVRPDVLLLDEPLSALDPETRENMQHELRQMQRLLRITALHVTHDFEEAVSLGDRIAVIGDGEIKQVGTPEEIFRKPGSEFVARFTMCRNIYDGTLLRNQDGSWCFKVDDTVFLIRDAATGVRHASVRPDDVQVLASPPASGNANSFVGVVDRIADKGSVLYVTVNLPPAITAVVTRRVFRGMGIKVGMKVFVTFDASSVHVF